MTPNLTLATKITLLRLFLVPFVAMGILYHRFGMTLILFTISGLTDAVDGLLARKMKQKTPLGALLDPVADKLLLSTSFLLLTFSSSHLPIPLWLGVLVFSRDFLILVSAAAIVLTTGFTKFEPSIWGKASTVVQVVCVVWVLIANYFRLPAESVEWLFYVAFGFTLFSGIHYIYTFTKRFNLEENEQAK